MEPLKGLARLLSHYKAVGLTHLPKGPEVERLLAFDPERREADIQGPSGTNMQGADGKGPDECSTLLELKQALGSCRRCRLHQGRTKVVFGEGAEDARLMLVGEAPGRKEDLEGRPFVGRSGELLTKMLRAISIERQEVFITSVVKCRPPGNRTPKSDEIQACLPWLKRQIELIRPSLILCLGTTSAHALLGSHEPMARLRGRFHELSGFNDLKIKVAVTYHPAYLLRFGGAKQKSLKLEAWHDLQMVERLYKELQGRS